MSESNRVVDLPGTPTAAPAAASGANPKRRRRRRKKGPAASGAVNTDSPAPRQELARTPHATSSAPKPQRSAQRPALQRPAPQRPTLQRPTLQRPQLQPTPEKLVAKLGAAPVELAKEQPLSAEELETVRRGLRFLREHRKLLKLKLNAQEDLLVNGARLPDHRGVCTHLFAKVEYARVHAIVDQLKPEQRAAFMEGVLLFSSDLSTVLLYLEALRDGANRSAGSALQQALKRIDFHTVSEGQLRRVLDLVLEVFGKESQTRVLLHLFDVPGFSEKLQVAFSKLPAPLCEVLAPLWETYQTLLRPERGRPPNLDPSPQVVVGVNALLELDGAALLGLHPKARERILRAVLPDSGRDPSTSEHPARFNINAPGLTPLIEHASAELQPKFEELRLLRWLALGDTAEATRRVAQLAGHRPLPPRLQQLSRALAERRIGRVAVGDRVRRAESVRFFGTCLQTLRPLYVRVIDQAELPELEAALLLQARCQIPSVSQVHSFVTSPTPASYLAVVCHGKTLERKVAERPAFLLRLRWAIDAVLLLRTLEALGVGLPDTHACRFDVDSHDRLWLTDLWSATNVSDDSAPVSESARERLARAIALVTWLLGNAPLASIDANWGDSVAAAASYTQLLQLLASFELALPIGESYHVDLPRR